VSESNGNENVKNVNVDTPVITEDKIQDPVDSVQFQEEENSKDPEPPKDTVEKDPEAVELFEKASETCELAEKASETLDVLDKDTETCELTNKDTEETSSEVLGTDEPTEEVELNSNLSHDTLEKEPVVISEDQKASVEAAEKDPEAPNNKDSEEEKIESNLIPDPTKEDQKETLEDLASQAEILTTEKFDQPLIEDENIIKEPAETTSDIKESSTAAEECPMIIDDTSKEEEASNLNPELKEDTKETSEECPMIVDEPSEAQNQNLELLEDSKENQEGSSDSKSNGKFLKFNSNTFFLIN
jgi:hypothetical protein